MSSKTRDKIRLEKRQQKRLQMNILLKSLKIYSFSILGAGIAPVDLTTISSLRARWTLKTVVKCLVLLHMCILHFVSMFLTLLISGILSNISFIKLSPLLSGYPASSFFFWGGTGAQKSATMLGWQDVGNSKKCLGWNIPTTPGESEADTHAETISDVVLGGHHHSNYDTIR